MLPWPSRGPKGMPRPWHPTHGACHALAMLPLPLRHPACPQGPCCLRPGACQRAHACTPRPWLLHARPGLGCCVLAQALPAACSPRPCLLSAHGGLPWPWLLHAHALAACPWGAACMHAQSLGACPWGAALALAAACPCLGCLPMGAALALA